MKSQISGDQNSNLWSKGAIDNSHEMHLLPSLYAAAQELGEVKYFVAS
ncbi:MAG: hypothetical protein ACJ71K_13400 [Nitrososphaeraceae archaeon]